MPENAYIIFLKYPSAGKVKTRIGRHIGYDKASELYRMLVERLTAGLGKSYDTLFFIEPYSKLDDFQQWLGYDHKYLPQKGDDLGEKMSNALSYAFNAGYKRAVLTGSDIPELTSGIIEGAFTLLEKGDAVIGSAEDGGYYLIGFNHDKLTDKVFRGINWSTDIVFSETMHIFKKIKYNVKETAKLSDLDTLNDLKRLRHCIKEITDSLNI